MGLLLRGLTLIQLYYFCGFTPKRAYYRGRAYNKVFTVYEKCGAHSKYKEELHLTWGCKTFKKGLSKKRLSIFWLRSFAKLGHGKRKSHEIYLQRQQEEGTDIQEQICRNNIWWFYRAFLSVIFYSGQQMVLIAFYFIRALTKALTYY